jgi:hypothetical protein
MFSPLSQKADIGWRSAPAGRRTAAQSVSKL